MSGPLILGIESSCDETGVGLVRGHELLANEVASSVELHVRYGGVVPRSPAELTWSSGSDSPSGLSNG